MPSRREREKLLADEVLVQARLADMEWKLHTARAMMDDDMQCACYLIDNRERLLPVIVANAIKNQEDADHAVHRFVQGAHKRHTVEGHSLVSEERLQHATE